MAKEFCSRGHRIASWSDVDTYCNRCQVEMPAEIERLTRELADAVEALRELHEASVFAMVDEYQMTPDEARRWDAAMTRADAFLKDSCAGS